MMNQQYEVVVDEKARELMANIAKKRRKKFTLKHLYIFKRMNNLYADEMS
jgi:hypothetical protein